MKDDYPVSGAEDYITKLPVTSYASPESRTEIYRFLAGIVEVPSGDRASVLSHVLAGMEVNVTRRTASKPWRSGSMPWAAYVSLSEAPTVVTSTSGLSLWLESIFSESATALEFGLYGMLGVAPDEDAVRRLLRLLIDAGSSK